APAQKRPHWSAETIRHHPCHLSIDARSPEKVKPVEATCPRSPEAAAGMKPARSPMPYPRSRAQLDSTIFTTPPDPEYATRAPRRKKSAPAGRGSKAPRVRSKPPKRGR